MPMRGELVSDRSPLISQDGPPLGDTEPGLRRAWGLRMEHPADMQIRFWGTRGSIAAPGPSTVRYGGNTSCVELRSENGVLLVLDCGTGARLLGRQLVEQAGGNGTRGSLLLGHTHWDHIERLPFFEPRSGDANWDI